jgi:hypothetical protein
MNRAIILAFFGFGFCLTAAVKVLPSGDMLALINDENVFSFLGEFLVAFIKNPFAWAGIIILFIAFREPVLSRNSSAHRLQRRVKPKI